MEQWQALEEEATAYLGDNCTFGESDGRRYLVLDVVLFEDEAPQLYRWIEKLAGKRNNEQGAS